MPDQFEIRIAGVRNGLALTSLTWVRSVGSPVSFELIFSISDVNDDHHAIVKGIADNILNSKLHAQVFLNGNAASPELIVTDVSEDTNDSGRTFKLSGHRTDLLNGIYKPRKRVIKGDSMKELLLDHFRNYLCADDTIEKKLISVDLRSKGDKPCYFFQDSLSDLECMIQIIKYYNFGFASSSKDRIMLTGCERDTKFRICWADQKKMVESVHPTEVNNIVEGPVQVVLGYDKSRRLNETHSLHNPRSVCYRLRRASVSTSLWQDWIKAALPVKYYDKYALQVIDKLEAKVQEGVKWYTDLVFFTKVQLMSL